MNTKNGKIVTIREGRHSSTEKRGVSQKSLFPPTWIQYGASLKYSGFVDK